MFSSISTTEAILALCGYATVALLWIGFAVSPAVRSSLRRGLAPYAVAGAWIVATACTLGSLYLSEIAHLVPCRLCWYQRIAMYPLVVLLGIAAVRVDLRGARRYAIPLAVVGAVISTYHYQLERFPNQPTLSCGLEVPCSVPVVNVWGFASVPFMALSGFLLIATLLTIATPHEDRENGWDEDTNDSSEQQSDVETPSRVRA